MGQNELVHFPLKTPALFFSLLLSPRHVARSHCDYDCYYILWNQINAPHDCWIKIERTWYTFEDCPSRTTHMPSVWFQQNFKFHAMPHKPSDSQPFSNIWFCVFSINHRAEIIIILGRLSSVFILCSLFYCFTRDDRRGHTCIRIHIWNIIVLS